jgi:hypothetical protein
MGVAVRFAWIALAAALITAGRAAAEPAPPSGPAQLPSGTVGAGEPGINAGGGGVNVPAPALAPAAAALFLCPGVGAAASSFGGGGGYCDFDFEELMVGGHPRGNMHVHCEWGGFVPVVDVWNCWRVFPGQPDHPRLPDPDIIPDGWGVPNALGGPTPDNQWPPPGMVPAGSVGPPPPPAAPLPDMAPAAPGP